MTPDNGIIIVTGSNGQIGDAVMRRFVGRFADVVGFDRKDPMALADVGRALRFVNVLFGAWVIAALWLLGGGPYRLEVERRDRGRVGDPVQSGARPGGRALRELGAFHPVSHDATHRRPIRHGPNDMNARHLAAHDRGPIKEDQNDG